MHGRGVLLEEWDRRFDEARVDACVADVVGVGDTALAAVCFQAYAPDESPIGPSIVVASRFGFEEDRISRLQHTSFNDVPDEVKALFHVH